MTEEQSPREPLNNHFHIVTPARAVLIGRDEDEFLGVIQYWCARSKTIIDGVPWIHNTYAEWLVQFPHWKRRRLERTVLSLRMQDLILTRTDHKTNHFAVNEDAVSRLPERGVSPIWRKGLAKSSVSSIIHRLPKGRSNRAEDRTTKKGGKSIYDFYTAKDFIKDKAGSGGH